MKSGARPLVAAPIRTTANSSGVSFAANPGANPTAASGAGAETKAAVDASAGTKTVADDKPSRLWMKLHGTF